jgi:type II secretory pathway pseudopilin PulG
MDWSTKYNPTYNQRYTKGFSLVEMIIIVGIIIGMLLAVGGLWHVFQTQNDVQISATTYAQALRRAQSLAESTRGDSDWGVVINASSVTIFQGVTYATRISSFDETYSFGTALIVTGLSEVDFTKFTGLPMMTGTTTISATGATASKIININAKGNVTY